MTEQEVNGVHIGSYLRDDTDGKIFRVLCNCGSSSPRRHTERYVKMNADEFSFVQPQDLAEHLGVPYSAE